MDGKRLASLEIERELLLLLLPVVGGFRAHYLTVHDDFILVWRYLKPSDILHA